MEQFYSQDVNINIWRILVAANPAKVTMNGDIRILKVNQYCTVTRVDKYATIFATNEYVASTVIDMALMMEKYANLVVAKIESQY